MKLPLHRVGSPCRIRARHRARCAAGLSPQATNHRTTHPFESYADSPCSHNADRVHRTTRTRQRPAGASNGRRPSSWTISTFGVAKTARRSSSRTDATTRTTSVSDPQMPTPRRTRAVTACDAQRSSSCSASTTLDSRVASSATVTRRPRNDRTRGPAPQRVHGHVIARDCSLGRVKIRKHDQGSAAVVGYRRATEAAASRSSCPPDIDPADMRLLSSRADAFIRVCHKMDCGDGP